MTDFLPLKVKALFQRNFSASIYWNPAPCLFSAYFPSNRSPGQRGIEAWTQVSLNSWWIANTHQNARKHFTLLNLADLKHFPNMNILFLIVKYWWRLYYPTWIQLGRPVVPQQLLLLRKKKQTWTQKYSADFPTLQETAAVVCDIPDTEAHTVAASDSAPPIYSSHTSNTHRPKVRGGIS